MSEREREGERKEAEARDSFYILMSRQVLRHNGISGGAGSIRKSKANNTQQTMLRSSLASGSHGTTVFLTLATVTESRAHARLSTTERPKC